MTEERSADETLRELLHRVKTEGVIIAYETAVAICKDPKAPAPAKATASTALFRVGGLFDKKEGSDRRDPSEMTPEEIAAEIARLRQLRRGLSLEETNVSVFD